MKKINYLLIAAIASLTVASCQKEQAEPFNPAGQGAGQEFTVSLPEVTKTALVEGKTVWAKNDSLWVSNGTLTEKIGVPEESWGQKSFTFKTKGTMITPETPNMYVVYPYEAAAGVKEGKLSVKIPGFQKGEFNEANIVAAQTTTYSVSLKNVTAILKVTVPPQAETKNTPIYSLAIGATNGNALSGTCTVDFSGSDPVLTPTAKSTSISAQIDGLDDKDFYFAVIPGTYDAGFTLTAATTSFEYASETKTTKSAKTVKVNELVNLGSIGTDLKPLPGAGTETDPWQIESLGHMIALASAVAEGNTFEGKYLKVMNDISGITMPVGYFPNADNNHPFCGDFDGNGKTLTIDINGAAQPSTIRLGLFGALNSGANIHNLTIDGSITSTGDALGGVAGRIDAVEKKGPVIIDHVINKADITGPSYLGGIVGYIATTEDSGLQLTNCTNEGTIKGTGNYIGGLVGASSKNKSWTITNCENKGAVSGNVNIGGIAGFAYYCTVKDCSNAATSTVSAKGPTGGIYGVFTVNGKTSFTGSTGWDQGTAGIVGSGQNVAISNCSNSGAISGVTKVAGIMGVAYWSSIYNCTNDGTIKGTGTYKFNDNMDKMSIVGGIVGLARRHTSKECTNNGDISGNGAVGGIGGYVGGESPSSSNQNDNSITHITDCVNNGTISGTSHGVGGVVGIMYASSWYGSCFVEGSTNNGKVINSGRSAGGIVGMAFDLNNTQRMTIQDCTNKADVDASVWAGGIIGQFRARTNTTVNSSSAPVNYITIKNSENSGTITGTRSDSDGGEVVGGIIGASSLGNGSGAWMYLYNCLNTGSVLYKTTSYVKPYCGGIVGFMQRGKLDNVCNHGYVGPVGGASQKVEGADDYLGGLCGSLEGETDSIVKEAYYLESSCAQPVGKAKNQISTNPENINVSSYDADGILKESTVINSKPAQEVDVALNLWITENKYTTYYSWAWNGDKPAFVKE